MRWYVPILLFLVLLPLVSAEEEESCSITNLAICLPEAFFDYVLTIINAPVNFLLDLIKDLLGEPVDPSGFKKVWTIVTYVISILFSFVLFWAGFNFMISGYDLAKREKAKEWLRNVLIMMVLVGGSYFLYSLLLDMSSAMTSSIFNMIDNDFFLFTADSLSNVGLELALGMFYMIVLVLTIVILAIRYLIISFGVALFPIGIFLYMIPPLKGYGKSILSFLLINVFMGFFASLILLVGSALLDLTIFQNFQILVMIASFTLVDLLLFYFLFAGLIMGALSVFLSYKTFGLIKVIGNLGGKK